MMALILFTFFLAPLSQLPPGCERGTYNGVDVYRCRGYDVALRGYLVSLSNCVPGDVSCLGQAYFSVPAGEWIHQAMSITGPIEYSTHLAFFPFSYCVPRFPMQTIRDPYVYGSGGQRRSLDFSGQKFQAQGEALTGVTSPDLPSADCYIFTGISLQEALAEKKSIEESIGNIINFTVRLVTKVSKNVPIRRITAYYGYTINYFDGYRFHEGLDTSWNISPFPPPPEDYTPGEWRSALASIWTPLPLMPVIIYPGMVLGMMPCNVSEEAIVRPYPQGGLALLRDIRNLEAGLVPAEQDCAVLFGGLHVVTDAYDSSPYIVSGLVHGPACAGSGRLPLECDYSAYTQAGGFLAPCAQKPGYAGAVTPHCHYQAVALSGDQARELLRELRQNPSNLIRRPEILGTKTTEWEGSRYTERIYARSFDPLFVLFPELAGDTSNIRSVLINWRLHHLPDVAHPHSPSPVLFVGWYSDPAEFYPGMPDISGGGIWDVEPPNQQTACRKVNKSIPGWGCKPSGSVYNYPTLKGDNDPVLHSERLSRVLANVFRAVSIFRSRRR